MTSTERNTLLLLFGLGVVGHGVRLLSLAPEDAPGGVSILSQLPPADIGRQRARALKAGRPLAAGERIDLNQAPAEEIARLPRVGLAMAKRVVKAREETGGFTEIGDLDSLPGFGARLLAAIADHVGFGDTARARRARDQAASARRPAVFASPAAPPPGPVIVRSGRTATVAGAAGLAPLPPVHLNRATERDLVALPGIGPTRAKAILAYRQTNGPFASVSDLEKVPGLPRRVVRQLATQVVIP